MKTDQQMVRWALEESPEPIIKNPYLRSAFRGGQLVQHGPGRPGYAGDDQHGSPQMGGTQAYWTPARKPNY